MRISIRTLVAAAALASCAMASAATPALPATVAAAVKEIAAICTESGGKALTDNAVRRADLNADGKDDYILDVASVNCDGAASVYGDREKGVTVFLGDGKSGAKQVFSDVVFGIRIEGEGPAAKLWLTVSGQQCGRKPAADFASESFCDRAITWNAKTQAFDYAPVSTVKMIE